MTKVNQSSELTRKIVYDVITPVVTGIRCDVRPITLFIYYYHRQGRSNFIHLPDLCENRVLENLLILGLNLDDDIVFARCQGIVRRLWSIPKQIENLRLHTELGVDEDIC